ncbi:hypothetical protein PseudUWO311_15140 [Pseudanabaena sp. UWO311]|uniref:hypothetical protein n=1 Tax=Pseudanabaena sp. UWO311 TaxID=2487337 RepID=UPI00115C3D2A|nr:hypothetical protein [Pseudanabaena sp. UWO311]TYQ25559.1 hypothetical protein PseudUWO311_15140 [Pseudanabaena sp. UWO311]
MINQEFPPLSDEEKVYRAIARKKGWIDPETNDVTYAAFELRLSRDPPELKLSVLISPEKPSNFTTYGFIEIQVKDIRALGLDVIRDSKTHLSIIGIQQDLKTATDTARKLAKKAKVV